MKANDVIDVVDQMIKLQDGETLCPTIDGNDLVISIDYGLRTRHIVISNKTTGQQHSAYYSSDFTEGTLRIIFKDAIEQIMGTHEN